MSNSSIWPIDKTLSSATTPGQSGPGSNGKEGVLYISQSSKTGTSPLDCFISYPEHLLVRGCTSCSDAVGVSYRPSRLGSIL